MICETLQEYMTEYGQLLGQQAAAACRPLHQPGLHELITPDLLRQPFVAQQHVITGAIRALDRQNALLISGEMGTGKTLMSQAIVQGHAQRHNHPAYRALIFCPPHLVHKWAREITITVKNAHVHHINSYHDLTKLQRGLPPCGRGWWIVSNMKAKMGPKWKPSYLTGRYPAVLRNKVGIRRSDDHNYSMAVEEYDSKLSHYGFPYCPKCHTAIEKEDKDGAIVPPSHEEMVKKRYWCYNCGEALWQFTHEIDRWPVATYIHQQLNGYFKYLVIDECFPGDALVSTPRGPRPIRDIRVGDAVVSYSGGSQCVRMVSRTIKKYRRVRLVRLTHNQGVVRCTENHKFYVKGRLVEAKDLRPGDRLTINDRDFKRVRAVQKGVRGSTKEAGTTILQSGVPRSRVCGSQKNISFGDVRDVQKGVQPLRGIVTKVLQSRLLRNRQEGRQHEAVQAMRKDILPSAPRDGLLQQEVQWVGSAEGENVPCLRSKVLLPQANAEVLRLGVRSACHRGHSGGEETEAAIVLVEEVRRVGAGCGYSSLETEAYYDRPCPPRRDGRNRDRWNVAPETFPEGAGPQEGKDSPWAGVACYEVLERTDPCRPGEDCGESAGCRESAVVSIEAYEDDECEFVYDLEVDDTHCYFADGVLVSNCHQTKSPGTAVGQAMGSLAAACEKTICMTGTIIGGYANHIRSLLYRVAPRSLLAEGLTWKDAIGFDERYGRIEKVVTETSDKGGSDNKQSIGRTSSRTQKYVRPGVMPTLFGRHLIQNTVFLSLDEVAENLPQLEETVIPAEMDRELFDAYKIVEDELKDACREAMKRRDKSLLSKMLQTLLAYPDHPYGWEEIGYMNPAGHFVKVTEPENLSAEVVRAKEELIVADCLAERDLGRKSWVYCVMTDTRDVNERLRGLLAAKGLRVNVLRSSVATDKREAWIAQHAPQCDVMISHPQLVETGLDLFDPAGSYNFPTLSFYSTGYNLFTLRQAARRAWRIGQKELCKVRYYYYAQTMQARAMTLMGKKLAASTSVEGHFSSEGLAAMAGDEGSLEMAMARSLVEQLDDSDVGRAWSRMTAERPKPTPVVAAAAPGTFIAKPTPKPTPNFNRFAGPVKKQNSFF